MTGCGDCPIRPIGEAQERWVNHLMMLKELMNTGCRFSTGDLTFEEWIGLAELERAFRQIIDEENPWRGKPSTTLN